MDEISVLYEVLTASQSEIDIINNLYDTLYTISCEMAFLISIFGLLLGFIFIKFLFEVITKWM